MLRLVSVYRGAGRVARPFLPLWLVWRGWIGRGTPPRQRRERLGVASLPRPGGRLVWLHVAAPRDAKGLLSLVERLAARGLEVLITTRLSDGADGLRRVLPAGSMHQFMPLDVPACMARFLDHWRPDLVLIAGGEFWPALITESGRRAIPTLLVNARMDDRTFAFCRRLPGVVRPLLSGLDLCLVQTELDAERLQDLGATSIQVVGDLAFDQPLPGAEPAAVTAFGSRLGARPVWVAGLIEPEEHAFILDTHRRLLTRYRDLVTVVLPRLPRDGEALARAAGERGFEVALRSVAGLPQRLPSLFIADVAGEHGLFYRTGDIVFVGRTFAAGGRSPIEAARLGCAIVHGPKVQGYERVYEALDAVDGAVRIKDAAELAEELAKLFDDGVKLRRMQRNAMQAMEQFCGGTSRVMRALEPYFVQMAIDL